MRQSKLTPCRLLGWIALGMLLASASSWASDLPSLRMPHVRGFQAQVIQIDIEMDAATATVQGLQTGVCYDVTVLSAISIELGSVTAGSSFTNTEIHPDGVGFWFIGGCFHCGGESILPGSGYVVATIEFEVIGPPQAATTLTYCDVGPSNFQPLVLTSTANWQTPDLVDGSVLVNANFQRGDCNNDGFHNLADSIFLEQYLFLAGQTPACLSACDTNDDGSVNVADSVYNLLYLFASGPPLPAPYGACGPDLTPDELPCLASASCP